MGYVANKNELDVSLKGLYDIIVPDYVEQLDCYMNNLEVLVLPDNIIKLYCWENNIKDLLLKDKLNYLSCDIFVNVKNIYNKELKIDFW